MIKINLDKNIPFSMFLAISIIVIFLLYVTTIMNLLIPIDSSILANEYSAIKLDIK